VSLSIQNAAQSDIYTNRRAAQVEGGLRARGAEGAEADIEGRQRQPAGGEPPAQGSHRAEAARSTDEPATVPLNLHALRAKLKGERIKTIKWLMHEIELEVKDLR
jgi:hypothetical protein